ncbi:hypothetical protein PCC7418_1754 [Halothece sp. PCC 7418]|nr:hypothetical protein PCC7418_1754 [Halothece sp. PCC 7418]
MLYLQLDPESERYLVEILYEIQKSLLHTDPPTPPLLRGARGDC